MSKPRWNREIILSAARQTAKELEYDRLKPEQEEVVLAFLVGRMSSDRFLRDLGRRSASRLYRGRQFDKQLRGGAKRVL